MTGKKASGVAAPELPPGIYPNSFYRISVKAIIRNNQGEMLAIKEGNHELLWELPGGGLDHGEAPLEGLKRELREELGITQPFSATLASITSNYFPRRDYWKLFITYNVTILGDYKLQLGEANAMIWLPVAEYNAIGHPVEPKVAENWHKKIVISGSLRFTERMIAEQYRLESEGNLVIGCTYMPPGLKKEEISAEEWALFDEIHQRKIDLADAIFVVNVGGYIGDSTRSEIAYAKSQNKEILYLEAPK